MKGIPLKNHLSGCTVWFDPATGEGTRRLGWISKPGVHFGFAQKNRGEWFAVYVDEGVVYFQHGPSRWSLMDKKTTIQWERLPGRGWNVFRILNRGQLALEDEYKSARSGFFAQADPTYDGLDEELDDLFLRVARCMQNPDWVGNVANLWGKEKHETPTKP